MLAVGFIDDWRFEFRAIFDRLSEWKGNEVPIRLLRPRDDYGSVDVLVVSGAAQVDRNFQGRIVRFWWNDADEILLERSKCIEMVNESHVTFFNDVAEEVRHSGMEIYQIPYAFAPVLPPGALNRNVIAYIGEVDISGRCFEDPVQRPRLNEIARLIAVEVAEGRQSLSGVAELWGHQGHQTQASGRTMDWAVRNWFRRIAMARLRSEFGCRLRLRGTDWRSVGERAGKTVNRMELRRFVYRRSAISIDLGSKSTSDALFPRTSEIIGFGGNLVQVDAGVGEGQQVFGSGVRPVSIEELVDICAAQLAVSPSIRRERARGIQADYAVVQEEAISAMSHLLLR